MRRVGAGTGKRVHGADEFVGDSPRLIDSSLEPLRGLSAVERVSSGLRGFAKLIELR